MLCFNPSMSIPRCSSSTLYLHSSHFRRKCMDLRRFFRSPSNAFGVSKYHYFGLISKQIGGLHPLKLAASVSFQKQELHLGLTSCCPNTTISWNARNTSLAVGGVSFGVWLNLLSSGTVNAKASMGNIEGSWHKTSSGNPFHGKEIHTNYSITGIPGDGRCLFRSVVHGACIRAGKSVPNETLQRELADELRSLVADEFIKRREETEWFIEGKFDDYVSHIRQLHVWGGEPELLMSSHVLQMPIIVYIYDDEAGGLLSIAEYGQEYGKEDPIRVLYHDSGHYDALQFHEGRQRTQDYV